MDIERKEIEMTITRNAWIYAVAFAAAYGIAKFLIPWHVFFS